MKRIYITSLLFVVFTLTVSAQVANYVFTQFAGTYSAVTGGTVFGNTTSDDQVFVDPAVPLGAVTGATGPGIPIGFNFVFNNIIFDRFGINNNGWIFLGQSSGSPAVNSQSSSSYNSISATSTAPANLQHRIAALSRDLQAQVGGDLRVQTIGTSPNQICVIQWNNYRKFAATGDSYNFQIRLYETSNVVEVVYGSFVNNATTSTAEVGLRGSINTDFNNRNVTTANSWAASNAGLVNNSNCTKNGAGLVPNNGQVYRWTPPAPCSGLPSANSVLSTQTLICPNAAALLTLANSYTNVGLSYQWFSSTVSSVGPFTPITGATLTSLNTGSLNTSTYYNVAITCTLTNQTTTASTQNVIIAGTTTNSIPYYESFEDIVLTNQLPNCSWASSSPSVVCQTYTVANANNRIPRTGSKFAAFRFGTNVNGDYFYSSGLQLEPGITYSATVWYITDGLAGWQSLSMGIGTAQSAASMTTIATLPSVPSGQFYQALTNTFVVASSGLYHLGIRCVANSVPQFLSIDDISITIPCSLNAPQISVASSANPVCKGQAVTLTAAGNADFSWSNGILGASTTVVPPVATILSVTATNTLTGCSSVQAYTIGVLENPALTVFAPQTTVCAGSVANIYAFGADQYAWSNGSNGAAIQVTPTSPTIYTVVASWNQNNCISTATLSIFTRNLPLISLSSSREGGMCVGESATLSVLGQNLVSGSWTSNNITINNLSAVVAPNQNTTYTVIATDNFGCSKTATITQEVQACVGITEQGTSQSIAMYPNPTSGKVVVGPFNGTANILVSDISGKVVATYAQQNETAEIDLSDLSNGMYYITVKTAEATLTQKVIKN